MKLLHVEDDDSCAKLVARALAGPDCQIDRARNASEALLLIEANGNGYDAILLDLGLPDVPREETLRLMHSCSGAPKVVNSGDDVSWIAGHEAELGVYGVIPKGNFSEVMVRHTLEIAVKQWTRERREKDVRRLLDTAAIISSERRRQLATFKKTL